MGTPMINPEQALQFTFLFLRISAILIMIPVIGEGTVPLRVKGGMAILVSLLLLPTVHIQLPFSVPCQPDSIYTQRPSLKQWQ